MITVYGILALIPLICAGLLFVRSESVHDDRIVLQVVINSVMGLLCYFGTVWLIPILKKYTYKAGLKGIDLNKPGNKEDKTPIPESQGVVSGVVFVICIIVFQAFYTFTTSSSRCDLLEYNAALHSIGFMLFLGFVDDVVDLPWRYKLILPSIATLPLLMAYGGSTTIIVPKLSILRDVIGKSLDLGFLYQLYMGLLAVFCTNAINIHAGINGLEAGQSFIIAVAILFHNILELSGSAAHNHLFSLFLVIPFIGVILGLLQYNFYPSTVFVGDTFTNFAGMTFAVLGILGHFSKTLLLFFIPQIINFLYSLPQILGLFGLVCPRHRLPVLNQKTGLLEGIKSHHNLVNLTLVLFGPMHERTLCIVLLLFQSLCCAIGFFIRYYIASYFY